MKILSTIEALKIARQQLSSTVGFVPTMGCLHQGHASLLKRSLAENDQTILSIFVNPTQFNNVDDLTHYPKTIEADLELAQELGVDIVFLPDYQTLYPRDFQFKVETTDPIAAVCEGASRPGHYSGVLTVVLKLLNLMQPTRAYFGEKDFQQVTLIKHMVESLFLDVDIIMCPIVRESSGLAMSSRNRRLSVEQRQRADSFAKTLQQQHDTDIMKHTLEQQNVKVDYIEKIGERLLAAVYIDDIRLIDTIC